MEKFLELGQIVNTKGLKGEVKVNSFQRTVQDLKELKKFF